MKRRSSRIVEALIVIVIIAAISYIALPIRPASEEIAKLEQAIPPLDYVQVQVAVVLQDIVDMAELPIEIHLCADLVDKLISVRTEQPMKLGDVLRRIGWETNREPKLFIGIEGTMARPTLLCLAAPGDFVVIQKRK